MALLVPQNVDVTGLEATYASAAAAGDTFVNTGRQMVHVKNGSGAPMTVTVDDPNSQEPLGSTTFDPDVEIIVTNAEERFIGPFDVARFGDAVALTYSLETSVTIAILQF